MLKKYFSNFNVKFMAMSFLMTTGLILQPSLSYGDQITWGQRKELFIKGTITDKKGNTWDVIYLPGTEKITNDAKDLLQQATDIMKEMAKKDFWHNRLEEVKEGYATAKSATKEYWINGIKEDYKEAKEKSAAISPNEFGGIGGKAAVWTKFGVLASGRTVTFPIGVAYGLGVESTLEPLVKIAAIPAWSGLVGVGGGVILPGIMYVWNGTAWVATSLYSEEPTTENFYVVLKVSGDNSKKETSLVIDKKGFDTLLMGSVVKALSSIELKALEKTAAEQYEAYLKTLKEQDKVVAERNANPQYKLLEKLLNDAYSKTHVQLNEEAKQLLMDEAQLTQLISEYLIQINVEPTEEKIAQVKETLKKSLKDLLTEVNTVTAKSALQ